jgi:hypothetical protein
MTDVKPHTAAVGAAREGMKKYFFSCLCATFFQVDWQARTAGSRQASHAETGGMTVDGAIAFLVSGFCALRHHQSINQRPLKIH